MVGCCQLIFILREGKCAQGVSIHLLRIRMIVQFSLNYVRFRCSTHFWTVTWVLKEGYVWNWSFHMKVQLQYCSYNNIQAYADRRKLCTRDRFLSIKHHWMQHVSPFRPCKMSRPAPNPNL
jgi:hypothetical protein